MLPAPFLRCAPDTPEQVFLDEAEHFRHNQGASVATLRELFAFGPECRSRSLRNQLSPSPESALEGEIASKAGDQPEKTYATGEMWMETPGQVHAVSRNASRDKPARLLAILLAEKGKQLTTPA